MFIWGRKGHFLGLNSVEGWFGAGNPRYIAGVSGIELAERVMEETGGQSLYSEYRTYGKSESYWAGWVLAYLQWYTGYTFEKINEWGISIPFLLALYPTHHEVYITKLVESATTKMDEIRNSSMNSLKRQ